MSRLLAVLLLLGSVLLTSPVRAQTRPASIRPVQLSGYVTMTGITPEVGRGLALGGTAGVIVERSRFLALDFRAVATHALAPLHTYIAEAGPRFETRRGRLRPFGEVLAGLGHSEYPSAKGQKNGGKGSGFDYALDGGLDLHIGRGFEWRVAEYSYTHISVGTGVSPNVVNSGVVYRF